MRVLILCRSLTQAQRGAVLLEREGIYTSVTKAPQGLSPKGCSYALSVYRSPERAAALLEAAGIQMGKVFRRLDSGAYEELIL